MSLRSSPALSPSYCDRGIREAAYLRFARPRKITPVRFPAFAEEALRLPHRPDIREGALVLIDLRQCVDILDGHAQQFYL